MNEIIFMDLSENRHDGPVVAIQHVVAISPAEWEGHNYKSTILLSSGGSIMTTLTVAEFLDRVNEIGVEQ